MQSNGVLLLSVLFSVGRSYKRLRIVQIRWGGSFAK